MGQTVELIANDGHKLSAYTADPVVSTKGGIVVIQEIFGVNIHIKDVSDRLAEQGYSVIAPALFDRVKPGVDLGYTDDDLGQGFGYMQEVGNEIPMIDIQAAAIALIASGKIGTMGFC